VPKGKKGKERRDKGKGKREEGGGTKKKPATVFPETIAGAARALSKAIRE
jgi:hypothetical protein